jgi:hypothetical protein
LFLLLLPTAGTQGRYERRKMLASLGFVEMEIILEQEE